MPAFTTIALTTLSAAGAGFSFAEAGKQNKLAREAQRDAAKALAEAKKKLEVKEIFKNQLTKIQPKKYPEIDQIEKP